MCCVSTSCRPGPATQCDACAVQLIRHRAVIDTKLGTDPAERPADGIKLGGSVYIQDGHPNFRRSRQPVLARRFCCVLTPCVRLWKIEVAGDVGSFICGAGGERLSTQRVFVVVLAGLAAQAAHFANRRRPQTILLMTGAASPEDLDEQHPCVHHCNQQAQQDAGDQPVEPAAHPKHQRHSAD
jgi:hypothetical protein